MEHWALPLATKLDLKDTLSILKPHFLRTSWSFATTYMGIHYGDKSLTERLVSEH